MNRVKEVRGSRFLLSPFLKILVQRFWPRKATREAKLGGVDGQRQWGRSTLGPGQETKTRGWGAGRMKVAVELLEFHGNALPLRRGQAAPQPPHSLRTNLKNNVISG